MRRKTIEKRGCKKNNIVYNAGMKQQECKEFDTESGKYMQYLGRHNESFELRHAVGFFLCTEVEGVRSQGSRTAEIQL